MASDMVKRRWRAAFAMVCALAMAAPATAGPQRAAVPTQPGYLGVELRNLTREEARTSGLPTHGGAAITKIDANSPGGAAGLRRGDILLEIEGTPVVSAEQALKLIASKKPGTVVTVRLLRDGKLRAGPVKLGAKPAAPPAIAALPAAEPSKPAPREQDAQPPAEFKALENQIADLNRQSKYAEALPLAERYVSLARQRHGEEALEFADAISWLGSSYISLARYDEARPLLGRALELYQRSRGTDHPDTLSCAVSLAQLLFREGRYGEAEPLFKRALEGRERVLGPEDRSTLASVSNLAVLYKFQGRYGEAEALAKRALEAQERVLGPEHPDTLVSRNVLAALYQVQSRLTEAEPLLRRVLEARERILGKEHLETLVSVNNLAALYQAEGRCSEAEPLAARALEGYRRTLGENHPQTIAALANLATLYSNWGDRAKALPLMTSAAEASVRVLGPDHPQTLMALSNLADLYRVLAWTEQAEPLVKHVLEARERLLGPDHPETVASVNSLATLYLAQRRYGEVEALMRRAMETEERTLGPDHPATLGTAGELAVLYFRQGDWVHAAQFGRRSTAWAAARTQLGAQRIGQAVTAGNKNSEADENSWQFVRLIKALYRGKPEGQAPDAQLTREMFEAAQWAFSSEAAQSLAQMAARGAKGDPALATLVRERQDLVEEWQKRDAKRNAALALPPEKRDAAAEAADWNRLKAIEARISGIDKQLLADFPDYASFASPAALSIEAVQAELRADEALVLLLDASEWDVTVHESFIWVVTKYQARLVRSPIGDFVLGDEVRALRCGLDAELWNEEASRKFCIALTGEEYGKSGAAAGPLPFDTARANRLYETLFGQVKDLIEGKQLLIVPSGALTQLPFQVLVTAPPASGDLRSVAWLIREHALTVLPAVSSLKALRRVARPSAAGKPMIGFGNPLLDGDPSYPQDLEAAGLARAFGTCEQAALQRMASLSGVRGVPPLAPAGGLADVSLIRRQVPLPETAIELCAVAADLGADPREIRLGARATEHEVKRLSETGELAQYRIVHFATHGALAGQVADNSEPGLLLTPPATPSEEDDGYLTASEIAGLKLDADWVILSACNTAAAGAPNAGALSGLARAFFYAQARALLVSHWEVNSDATVKLVTGAMRRLAADKSVGRAEAMRQSMLALIGKGESYEAHPAYWAPFVVVGEGGR